MTTLTAPATDGAQRDLSAVDLLRREASLRRMHPAQDVIDGVLWYGRPVEGPLVLVNSTRQALRADQLPAGLAVRHQDPGPSSFGRDAAMRWLTAGAEGSVAAAVDGVAAFLSRHVILPDRHTALWLGAWVVATWCYRGFRVFPYMSIRSGEKRCGKSRLLGLLARVAFNASPVTAHPTEAQLFRAAARTGGTQLYDEVETLRGDGDRFATLVTVLNVGFERGGVVTRLEHHDGKLRDQSYEVYAPRVLAGIAGLKDTLEDRALPVYMLRKRRAEPVARIGRATDDEAQAVRDACALACLTHIGAILEEYETAPALLEKEGLDDRAVDLWAPLLAVAQAADRERTSGAAGGDERGAVLLAVAHELSAGRDAEGETGPVARLVDALAEVRRERGERIAPPELLAALTARPGWAGVKTTRRLAAVLAPIGVTPRIVREGERRRWCYLLEADRLADLRARYGMSS